MSRLSRAESIRVEDTSFSSSIERSVGAADATLQQLATAKETFGDLEAAYRNFKHELEIVKNEHAAQVNQLQSRIELLQKARTAFEEQLSETKSECKKYQEELVTTKRTLAERDWEKENLAHEVTSCKNVISIMQKEREELEREINNLKSEISASSAAVILSGTKDESDQLLLARQEVSHWEENCSFVTREKEALQIDLLELQDKMAGLQAEYEKSQREILNCNKANSIKISKLEMQLQNVNKQKENFKLQLDESRDELRKSKEAVSVLRKDSVDVQRQANSFKEELAMKVRQVDKLDTINKELVSKVEGVKEQLSKQRISVQLHENQSKVIEKEMSMSQTKISDLEMNLLSARDERDETERELFHISSKLTTVEESYQRSAEKVKSLEIQNSSLRDSVSKLESELFAQRSKCSQIEPIYCQAKEQVEELTLNLEEAILKISQVESSHEAVVREKDDLREQLALSERKITETKALLQKTEEASNELEQKVGIMKSQLLKFEGQVESVSKQKSSFRSELEEERSKMAKLKKELAKAQSRYNEYERSVEWNKRESNNKDKTIDELRASIASYESKMESLFDEVNKLEAQMEVAEEEKRELQEETIAAQKVMREVTADNKLSSDENERLNLEIQSFYKRLSEVQASYNACEHEKHDFQHQVMTLQQKAAKLEAELEEFGHQRSSSELKVQEYLSTNGTLSQEIGLVKAQLLEQQRVCEEHHKGITEKDALIVQLQGKQDVLTVDYEASRQEMKELKEKYEASERDRKTLQNQLMTKQEEYSRAKGLYESTLKRKEQLEADLDIAQKRMVGLESSVKRSVVADKSRELTYEREKSTELAKELASYKSKLNSLESQTAITKNDIQGVLDELEEAEDKVSILKRELEEVTADRNERGQRLRFLEQRSSELEQENASSKQMKEKADQELYIMRTRATKYESQIEIFQKQRTQLKDQLDEANSKLICDKEHIMRLESKVTEEKKINETINKAVVRKDQLVEELQMKIRSNEADTEKLRNELMSFKVTTEGLRAEKNEYEGRIASYREKSEQRETEVFALRESITTMEQEISGFKFKTASVETQLSNLQRDKDHCQQEWNRALANVRKMQEELKVCQNQIKEKDKKLHGFTIDIKEKENALEKVMNEKIALETEMLSLQQDLDSIRCNYETSQSRASELEHSLDEANASISRLDLTISSFHSGTDELEQSRESCNAKVVEAEALFKQSQDREGALKLKIETYKDKLKKLETECRSCEQRNMELNHENHVLQRKLQECEMSFERCERDKKTMKEELVVLHGKVSDLEVKYEYERREKDSTNRQLEDVLQRVTSSREEFLQSNQQIIEQRLGAEVMQKKVDEKNKLIDQLKASKLYLEENIETLKSTLTGSREDCERMKLDKGRLQQEILSLTSSTNEYESRMQKVFLERDRVRGDYHSIVAKVSSLEQQMSEQKREKEALCRQIEDWKNMSLKYQDSGVCADKQIAELQSTNDFLSMDAKKKDQFIQELQRRNLSLEKEMDLLRKRLQKLEAEFETMVTRNRDLEFQSKSLVDISARESSAVLEEKAQHLEKEVVIQRRKVAELEGNCQASGEKEKELQDSLVVARVDASRWESQFDVALRRKKELELEVQALQKEVTMLKEEHQSSTVKLEEDHWKLQDALNKVNQQQMKIENEKKIRVQLENQLHENASKLKNNDVELLSAQRELQEYRLLWEQQGKTTGGKDSITEHLEDENQKMRKEVLVVRQELNSAQSLLTAVTRAKDEADQEMFILKRNVTEMQAKLNASQQEINELNSNLTSYHRKITSSGEEQQKTMLEQVTLRSQLDEASKKALHTRDELYEVQRETFALRASVERHQKELMEKDGLIKEQNTKIRLLEDELKSSKLRMARRSDEYGRGNEEVEKLKFQLQAKDTSISGTEGSLKVMLQENNKLKLELADLQASESTYKQYYREYQREVERLREEVVALQRKIAYLEAQNAAKEDEHDGRRRDLLMIEKTNAELKSKLDYLEREKRNLQAEISMTKAKYITVLNTNQSTESNAGKRSSLSNRAMEAGAREDAVLREKEEYLSEISLLRERVLDLESKWTEASKEKGKLQGEVEWRAKRIEDLESRVLKGKEDDREANVWQVQVAKLEQELIASKNSITRLEADRVSYEDKMKNTNEKLRLSEQRAFQLESAHAVCQVKSSSQQQELLEAQRKLSWRDSSIMFSVNETQNNNMAELKNELQLQLKEEVQLKRMIEEVKSRNYSRRDDLSKVQVQVRSDSKNTSCESKENASKTSVAGQIGTSVVEMENDLLKKEIASSRNDYQRALTEKRKLSAQLQKVELQVTGWETSYGEMKNENDGLRLQISALQKSYSEVKESRVSVTQEQRFNNAGIEVKHSAELESMRKENYRLNCEIVSQKSQLYSFKEKLDAAYLEAFKLEEKLAASEKRVSSFEHTNRVLFENGNEQRKSTITQNAGEMSAKVKEIERKNDAKRIYELQVDLDKVCHERDYLQQLLDLARSRSDYDRLMELDRSRLQEITEKEATIEGLRKEARTLQLEVGRLQREQRFSCNMSELESLKRRYLEVLNERDGLHRQFIELKSKSENEVSTRIESHVTGFQRQINDKNVMIDSLRSETARLQNELDTLRSKLTEKHFLTERGTAEVERLRDETNVLRTALVERNNESSSLKLKLDEACRERDFLIKDKTDLENDLFISKRQREETNVLKTALVERNNESSSLKLKLDEVCRERDFLIKDKSILENDLFISKKQISEVENRVRVEHSKKIEELMAVQKMFTTLESDYNEMKLENETLKVEMDFRVKEEVWQKQEFIYELEKEMRALKSENEYHQRIMEEKNANLSKLRLQIMSWQKEVEKLEKELFVSNEAYVKSELRMREIFNSQRENLTIIDLRSLISSTPALKTRNISRCEYSITDRKLADDITMDFPSFAANVTPIRGPDMNV